MCEHSEPPGLKTGRQKWAQLPWLERETMKPSEGNAANRPRVCHLASERGKQAGIAKTPPAHVSLKEKTF